MTPVTLPARLLAAAWLNVSLASSTDDSRPALYRTVLVEVFSPTEVRLIATDSYMILQAWVADDETPDPGIGVLPDPANVLLVADPDGLAQGLMKHLIKVTKDDDEIQHREVTLRVGSIEDSAQPTLMPELDRCALTFATDDYRVQCPVIEMPFPSWRQIWPTEARHAPAGRVRYSSEFLARFMKMRDAFGDVTMTFTTAIGPTVVEVTANPPLSGLLMPLRADDAGDAEPPAVIEDREQVEADT
jgi:DNA polymerase III sliding clamp (beta) subunit (PCNA family)